MLAKRLQRRGIFGGSAVCAALLTRELTFVPASLVVGTVAAAGSGPAASSVVMALAEGVLKTMLLTKLKNALTPFIMIGMLAASGAFTAMRHNAVAADSGGAATTAARTEPGGPPAKHATLRCHGIVEKIDTGNRTMTAVTLKGPSADDVAELLTLHLKRSLGLEKSLPALVNIPIAKRAKIQQNGKEIPLTDVAEKQIVALELAVGENGLEIIGIQTHARRDISKVRTPVIYRLKHLKAMDAATMLREALGPNRADLLIVAEPINNALLVSGTEQDIASLVKFLERMDDPAKANSLLIAIPLKHIKAMDAAKIVHDLFGPERTTVRVTSDDRTNTMLVWANEVDMLTIEKLLSQIDKPGEK
jgi:hypothetical protein